MAINNQREKNPRLEGGWPFTNYASEDRNLLSSPGIPDVGAISIPRFKFTWLAEFQVNERVFENPITNLSEFLTNGKIYVQLLSIDHPKPEIEYETFRSYNKWIKVPKVLKFPPASMTFHDDSTSVVMALWKEYLNFYNHSASIGDGVAGGAVTNLRSSNEINSYQYTHILTGEEMRARMGDRPSLGMRLKANDMRHFFEAITIYDLGTEPDGINAYWFHHPVITSWDHDNVDKEDRTGNVRVTANFEYEGYYFSIGKNRSQIRDWIETILGEFPDDADERGNKPGIARDGQQSDIDRRVENWDTGSLFPGEDALIQQAILGNQQEQLASTSFNSDAEAYRQEAMRVGWGPEDVAVLDDSAPVINPLGPDSPLTVTPLEEPPTSSSQPKKLSRQEGAQVLADRIRESGIQEPLTPSQTVDPLPKTQEGKRAELERTETELARLEQPPAEPLSREEGARRLAKRAQLGSRKQALEQALDNQRREDLRQRVSNPSSQSALSNTQATQGATAPTTTSTIPNPVNQQRADELFTASGRKADEASAHTARETELREGAQRAADIGNNNLSQRLTDAADSRARQAEVAQRESDALLEEAVRINPGI